MTNAEIRALVDQQWAELIATTITGKQYIQKGQPDTGRWGAAKALRDRIKAALPSVAPGLPGYRYTPWVGPIG